MLVFSKLTCPALWYTIEKFEPREKHENFAKLSRVQKLPARIFRLENKRSSRQLLGIFDSRVQKSGPELLRLENTKLQQNDMFLVKYYNVPSGFLRIYTGLCFVLF